MAGSPENVISFVWAVCLFAVAWVSIRASGQYLRSIQTRICPELWAIDERQREDVWNAAQGDARWSSRMCLLGVLLVVLFFVRYRLPRLFGITDPLLGASTELIAGVLVAALGPLAIHILWRRDLRRLVRREINHLGVPICMTCGQSLQGTAARTCNECGATHRAEVCLDCDGAGSVSRRHALVEGVLYLAAGIVIMVDGLWSIPRGVPIPERAYPFIFFRCASVLPGVLFLWSYFRRPVRQCLRCKGTGVISQNQGNLLPLSCVNKLTHS